MLSYAISALPLEGSVAPLIDVTHQQGGREGDHHPEGGEVALELHGPGQQEGRFHIEEDEEHGHQVELDAIAAPGVLLEHGHPAFVGGEFLGSGIIGFKEPRQEPAGNPKDADADRQGQEQQDEDGQKGRIGGRHGDIQGSRLRDGSYTPQSRPLWGVPQGQSVTGGQMKG